MARIYPDPNNPISYRSDLDTASQRTVTMSNTFTGTLQVIGPDGKAFSVTPQQANVVIKGGGYAEALIVAGFAS